MKPNKRIKYLIPFIVLGVIFAITLACSGTGGERKEEVELETKEQIDKEEVAIEETEEEVSTAEVSFVEESLGVKFTTFSENIFSFGYPSNWRIIDEEVVDSVLETSMRGWPKENFEYIGGVYIGEKWEEAIGEAAFSLFVISDPNFNGTITDEQYENVKSAYESEFGNRLLDINKITICDLPAIEIKTIGKSDKTQNWGIFIVPEISGRFYNLDLRARKELYPDYEPIFIDIVGSLEISK
jgi:hypothetical protein